MLKLTKLFSKLNEPWDPSGLGIARFFFGLLMIIDVFDERGLLWAVDKYGDVESCHFPLFDRLPILSVEYIHLVYFLLSISSVFIMIGFLYKLSCTCFVTCYWYLFLLDKTVWNNHSYLYGLLSILLLVCNGNYYWSVDGLLWPTIRNKSIPSWQYWVFRFQLFLLYFYAGIKKLDQEWLHGYAQIGLSKSWLFDPFHLFLSNENIDYFVVHLGGLILDLSAGFLLLFDRTRIIAFFFLYMFHTMNAIIFSIGMFSYMCMAMIPIFCTPDWPKHLIRKLPTVLQLFWPSVSEPLVNITCNVDADSSAVQEKLCKQRNSKCLGFMMLMKYIFVGFYIVVQLVLPHSHSITKGYNSWTQGLYGYSWDMMVHSWSTQHVVVKVIDEVSGNKQYLRPGAFYPLGSKKNRIFSHPDMLKQYALCLADRVKEMPELNISKPQIYFDVWKSMNSRYQQRMIDPNVDIVQAPWSPFEETKWLKPLLVELSAWRSTFKKIHPISQRSNKNATDIVFVADFPGLSLENYISSEIRANVTVLHGEILVETEDKNNITVATNETLTLPSDETHVVHTVTEKPSCYMYVYYNTTWVEKTEEELIELDPEFKHQKLKFEEWQNKTILQKFHTFLKNKLGNVQRGVRSIYFFMSVIFDVGIGENGGLVPDDF